MQDIIQIQDGREVDIRFYDGALPHAKGVRNVQVLRAHRAGGGWTYNHAAALAYFHGKFYLDYLATPKSEHVGPSRTDLQTSDDGMVWSDPVTIFPPLTARGRDFQGPEKEKLPDAADAVMHQRMSFFVSQNDRLLATGFYGLCPTPHVAPCNGWGIGRVVREIYPEGGFSPIYFIRRNGPAGYDEKTADYFPLYTQSPDAGFVAACDELLNTPMMVNQWWEEQRFDKALFTGGGAQALSFYTRQDGAIVSLFKMGLATLSTDGGRTFTPLARQPDLVTNNAKVWGQKTADGAYALVYNPSCNGMHRWPLAASASPDGQHFGAHYCVMPEFGPCRYSGLMKNLGPQYMRGIAEGNPRPDDGALWMAYSVNKEDIWVARIPLPLGAGDERAAQDDYTSCKAPDGLGWYAPRWGGVAPCCRGVVLRDRDPYDRAVVERAILPAKKLSFRAQITLEKQCPGARPQLDFCSERGLVGARIQWREDALWVNQRGEYKRLCELPLGRCADVSVQIDCVLARWQVAVRADGRTLCDQAFDLAAPIRSVARVTLATKPMVNTQNLETDGKTDTLGDLPNDQPRPETVLCLHQLAFEGE